MAGRKSTAKSDDLKQEDVLQAVVIADSFNVRFAPLTNSRPRTLLPLVNVPLLDYTLQFLSNSGVQRAYVICCRYAAQIKTHLLASKWMNNTTPSRMQVITVVNDGCMSVGDALRDIEGKSLIRSDFVLVHGDLVANLQLKPIIEEHRRRRQLTKGAIMTTVYKEAPPGHATRRLEDEVVIAVQSDNQKIIVYQRVMNSKKVTVPEEAFETEASVQIRHDLLDCHIAICSPHVLHLLADNFDYETIDDLIRGILENQEVLDASVNIFILNGSEYAARAGDPVAYAAVSQNVMARWTYPMVPDANITGKPDGCYGYGRHNLYVHHDAVLERGSVLKESVAVGFGTHIGENTTVTRSVIGRHCRIGSNVSISNCYIWDDVIIEDGCCLVDTIIDDCVSIGRGSKVKGSLIGGKVKLCPDTEVQPGSKLSVDRRCSIEGIEIVPFATDVFRYTMANGLRKPWDRWGCEDEVTEVSEEESEPSDFEEEEDVDAQPISEDQTVADEMASTLERALEDNISVDNVIVEINSIKHAYGVHISKLNGMLAKAVFALPFQNSARLSPPQYFQKFSVCAKRFHQVLVNYFRAVDSQLDLLQSAEELAKENETFKATLVKVIHYLYNELDVISEDAIMKWWNSVASNDLRNILSSFIEWLKTADEEESDEESD